MYKKKIITILTVMLFCSTLSFAAVTLSVNPTSGGNNLRFGRGSSLIEENKEVRIHINSNENKSYQVFQRWVSSPVNQKGIPLNTQAIQTYSLSGSNGSGTLYTQSPENVGLSDQLMYSSSTNGMSDSFTIVYALNPQHVNASGEFYGRLEYVVRLAGAPAERIILDVFVQADNRLKVTLEGSKQRDSLRIFPEDEGFKNEFVRIHFEGNTAQNIQIYQEMSSEFKNEYMQFLPQGVLQFRTTGDAEGEEFFKNSQALTQKRELIYSSEEIQDALMVAFDYNDALKNVEAGSYTGQVMYSIEQNHEEVYSESLVVNLDIAPAFQLDVVFPEEGMSFSKLLPDGEPQEKKVGVKVVSNLNKPYTVTQRALTLMTNSQGEKVPQENFEVKLVMKKNDRGTTSYLDYHAVEVGDTPLYISDAEGTASEFDVYYRLRPYKGMRPGDYATSIIYSLEEK